jgi:biofilm protein TabA
MCIIPHLAGQVVLNYRVQVKNGKMIIDSLTNAHRYIGLHKHFPQAFEFIRNTNLAKIEPGKYPIDGDEIHASVSLKDGYALKEAKFEAHDRYIDIQVCPSGVEKLGWKPRKDCVDPKTQYDTVKDVTFYNDSPETYFELHAGEFAIFYPEDVHAPMIGEGPVKKLVVKVRL